jgi:hypothetical protein
MEPFFDDGFKFWHKTTFFIYQRDWDWINNFGSDNTKHLIIVKVEITEQLAIFCILDLCFFGIRSFDSDIQWTLIGILCNERLECPHRHVGVCPHLYVIRLHPSLKRQFGLKHHFVDILAIFQLPMKLHLANACLLGHFEECDHHLRNKLITLFLVFLVSF